MKCKTSLETQKTTKKNLILNSVRVLQRGDQVSLQKKTSSASSVSLFLPFQASQGPSTEVFEYKKRALYISAHFKSHGLRIKIPLPFSHSNSHSFQVNNAKELMTLSFKT